MPTIFRRFWPFLALSALAVITAEPLTRAQLMCTDDAPFHLYRAVELGSLLELGHWFPRWAPHMAQGYGYPFFNFYAPLSSYAVVGAHWAGLAYPLALRAAFALGLLLAGASALLFVRRLFGERAGVAAGAAYLLAPYLAYDVLYRGNLAEAWGFIWPPLILLALHRLGRLSAAPAPQLHPSAFILLPALLYAALILTHNVFALIASPLLFGYAALLAGQAPERRARVLAWGTLSLLAGVLLSAYFWLPAVAERGLVHSDRLLVPPIFTWYTNFSSARELLGPLAPFDHRLINPSPPRTIGFLTLLAGLPALAAAFAQRRARPRFALTTAFFAAALLGYCLLNLELSAPVWELIGPLELVQFPWRMLGPAALCAAVLVGASVAGVEDWLARRPGAGVTGWPAALAVGLVFAGALPAWYAVYCPSPPTATLGDLVRYEALSHTLGTTAKGEYVPRTVARLPAETDLAQALEAGVEPSRLASPAGEAVRVREANTTDPLDAVFEVEAAAAAALVYRQFDYPGWQVTIDGQPAAHHATPDEGLIAFSVPAGTHTVRVRFGSTPLRGLAAGLSLATLAVVAGLRAARRRSPASVPFTPAGAVAPTPPGAAVLVAGVCVLAAALKLGVLDRLPPPAVPDGQSPVAAEHPLLVDVAGGVRLFGYDLSTTTLRGDGALDVAWYAGLREPTLRRWWPAVALEDETGLAWSALNPLPPRWHREPKDTPEWGPGHYAQWARHVTPLPGTPPGEYTLYGWVFDRDNLEIASVLDENGSAVAPRLALAAITVTRPRQPFGLTPPSPAPHAFGPLSLLGYDLGRAAAAAGETLPLALYWRSDGATPDDLLAQVELVDAAGQPALRVAVEPANRYPTSQWRPGDEWLGQTLLRLPAALPAGDYTLAVSVPGAADGRRVLTTLAVSAPERRFAPLPFATASGAAFGDVAVLEGYTAATADGRLTLSLAWRALGSPAVSYSVFVHLADEHGRVWAQSDAVPAGWTRPTTGWLAGEYVRDEHTLTWPAELPAGRYTLWVGLYDPLSSARLPARGPGAAADQRAALGQLLLP